VKYLYVAVELRVLPASSLPCRRTRPLLSVDPLQEGPEAGEVVPDHVDVAVRRPARMAGEVVAEPRKALPTMLAGEPLLG
jgi:hypothetical protein